MRAPAADRIFSFSFFYLFRTIASLVELCSDVVAKAVGGWGRGRGTVVPGGPLHDLLSMPKTLNLIAFDT